jgi:NADP-dependent 3-hydroxy acid dehydrogenase YdfG
MRAPGSDAPTDHPVSLIGATSHTGEFAVAELTRQGWPVIPAGRDPTRLGVLLHPGECGRLARLS